MNKEKLLIEGYQPKFDGYQPVATAQNSKGVYTPMPKPVTVNFTPPKGGTGEVSRK